MTRADEEIVIPALGSGRHKVTVTWPETNRSVVRTFDVAGGDDVVVGIPAR